MIKTYYHLTKPGIVYGNAIVALAAFIFGSHTGINWLQLGLMLFGLAGIIGSACVFNNYYDRKMDAKMERTKKRALASGKINAHDAISFGVLLLILGTTLLYFTNILTLAVALFGFIVYVFLYTPMKPRTGLAVFVGAVAGATPPVIGYAAATNTIDIFAYLLFAFLFLWQIPHFFAIARYRYEEYQAANVPLLVKQPKNDAERHQARLIFRSSLIILLVVCVALVVMR
jgi:protoheme IX farnesyltransferase